MTALGVAAVLAAVVATGLADLRWLRAAQREHYLAGSATRFALRWWAGPNMEGNGANRILAGAAVLGVLGSPISPVAALLGAVAIGVGPFRYRLWGRSPGPIVWTSRLRTVAAATGGAQAVLITGAAVVGAAVPVAVLVALVAPAAVDAALAAMAPLEDRKAERFVARARSRLEDVRPVVIAITGSYGKTTTKAYAAHLIEGSRTVVPTPASFNNRAGLSRAINEHLVAGTDVFIAEMGTYGRGEIAELCRWCPPSIAAITAIGPVHLERFGDLGAIVAAKTEILDGAGVAVLNVDDPRLAAVAERREADGQTVVRCSATDAGADVAARVIGARLILTRRGEIVADVEAPDALAGNVAVAAALAFAAGVEPDAVAAALATLPAVANRRTHTTLSTGATAIDDTFNANPAGSRAALATLERLAAPDHQRVVITPGMVELGPSQVPENRLFAADAARIATHVVVVGFTNRRALLAGVRDVGAEGRAAVLLADTHEQAVEWVRAHTGPGDVVLYENQLPDHYP